MYNGCSQCNCAAGGTTAQQAACNVLCFTEFWGTRSRFSPCSMTICIQAKKHNRCKRWPRSLQDRPRSSSSVINNARMDWIGLPLPSHCMPCQGRRQQHYLRAQPIESIDEVGLPFTANGVYLTTIDPGQRWRRSVQCHPESTGYGLRPPVH